jgi:hypothetical protein
MYSQVLILMRCVVAAEEYNMARHALPPIASPSQDARDLGDASRRRTPLEQRQATPHDAKTDHPGLSDLKCRKRPPIWPSRSTDSFHVRRTN